MNPIKFLENFAFSPSVGFYFIKTSRLICFAKQMTGFYVKYNTRLKWVKGIHELFASFQSCVIVFPLVNHKPAISVPKALKNVTSVHREKKPSDNYNMLQELIDSTQTIIFFLILPSYLVSKLSLRIPTE